MARPRLSPEENELFKKFLMPGTLPAPAPSSFDVRESSSPVAMNGMAPKANTPNFALTMDDITRPSVTDRLLNPPPAEKTPQDTLPFVPKAEPAAKTPEVDEDADFVKRFMTDIASPVAAEPAENPLKVVGQALSGFADAQMAGAGGKSNFLERTIDVQNKMGAQEKEARAAKEVNDPNSAKSKAYQALLAEMFPGMDVSKLSAAQAEKVMGPLGQLVDKREARKAAAEAKREKAAEANKPPKDYRWKADGSGELEPIPGGPADTSANDQSNRGQVINQAKNMVATVDQAIKQMGTGALTAGESGRIASWIPGVRQSRIDLENTISTLKANQAFQTLQKMREASKTGGALGQVSERELSLLENALASLDVNQSDKLLAQNLMKVKTHWQNALNAVEQIQKGGGTRSQAPAAGTVEDGYRFKGGNASDPKNWEPVS